MGRVIAHRYPSRRFAQPEPHAPDLKNGGSALGLMDVSMFGRRLRIRAPIDSTEERASEVLPPDQRHASNKTSQRRAEAGQQQSFGIVLLRVFGPIDVHEKTQAVLACPGEDQHVERVAVYVRGGFRQRLFEPLEMRGGVHLLLGERRVFLLQLQPSLGG